MNVVQGIIAVPFVHRKNLFQVRTGTGRFGLARGMRGAGGTGGTGGIGGMVGV